MAVYPRPAEQEQIVVRLESAPKTAPPARPAPDLPRGCMTEVDHGTCVEFSESRRTGNIAITLRPPGAREAGANNDLDGPSPVLRAAPSALDARPRPNAGMPAATGDFREDLRTVDAEAPGGTRDGTIEELMSQGTAEPTCATAGCGPATPAFRGGVDVRLARIIDAWPRLSARTRAAMTAALDDIEVADGPATAPNRVAPRPLAVRAARRGEGQANNGEAPARRRKGKA